MGNKLVWFLLNMEELSYASLEELVNVKSFEKLSYELSEGMDRGFKKVLIPIKPDLVEALGKNLYHDSILGEEFANRCCVGLDMGNRIALFFVLWEIRQRARYWLYAAVRFKCLLVTNDEMRDHLFELLGNSFFPIWKERHQVRFSGSKRSLGFHMPPPYSIVIQESESGSWHIPIVGGDDIETPRDWLCVTRCQRFELGQYQSHVLQESESQERESQSYSQLSDIKHKHAQAANGENCGVEELKVSRSTYRNGTPSNSSNKSFSSRARRTDGTKQGSFPSSPGQALHPRKMQEKQKLSP
ncbi:hypothetical protein KI387_041150 [Taxus chinensis]|uniref:ribonuclease P n=1 Tax=Taxus chinensis TaxID=29808 RepID=A0AA38F8Y9_TAXCH|nr:hypothetical protein KI387_041150 [Taxus chinensis]